MNKSLKKIKVLIVEDSALMRRALKDIINSDDNLEVIGTAANGYEGLDKVHKLEPDIVTLDINLPEMDGITCLQHIMIEKPTPCVMISAYAGVDSVETFEALELGAVDFIEKPSGEISRDLKKISKEITGKIKEIMNVNIGIMTRQKEPQLITPGKKIKSTDEVPDKVVVIGVSTGGPRTLMQILPHLPKTLNCPIVVVQHMPGKFTKSFADRINKFCLMKVKEAQNYENLKNNVIYVAPGDSNLKISNNGNGDNPKFITIPSTSSLLISPNVDIALNSAIDVFGLNTIGVILTGMGNDGENAMERLFNLGGYTIAESEESAVIYGMPRAVIDKKIARRIAPANIMSKTIVKAVKELI